MGANDNRARRGGSTVGGITAESEGAEDRGTVVNRNIAAATRVSDLVETTLGPRGRDKVVYPRDEHEDHGRTEYFQVTNNGAYLLKKVTFDSPAASMVARVAATQHDQYGDGTTTAAVYAGRVLGATERLLDRGFHPSTVIGGIDAAVELADEAIDSAAVEVGSDDRDLLEAVVGTASAGTTAEAFGDDLVPWLLDACTDGRLPEDAIQTESVRAGTLGDTEFVNGTVLKKSFAGNYAPRSLSDARIAVTDQAVTRSQRVNDRIESDANSAVDRSLTIAADDPDEAREYADCERRLVRETLAPLVEAGVDVLLVGNRVDEDTVSYLDARDVAVVRNNDDARLKRIAEATGATVHTHLAEFESGDAGEVGRLERREYPEIDQEVIFLRDPPEGGLASVLVHGSTWMTGWEAQRNVRAAVAAARATLDDERVLPGGGAAEVAIARHLRDAAPAVGGRESMVVEAVADAVEAVPRVLARNAGMDPTDALLGLRAAHAAGDGAAGVLGRRRELGNTLAAGVADPVSLKRRGLRTAAGVATTILRIDDVITGIDVQVRGDP